MQNNKIVEIWSKIQIFIGDWSFDCARKSSRRTNILYAPQIARERNFFNLGKFRYCLRFCRRKSVFFNECTQERSEMDIRKKIIESALQSGIWQTGLIDTKDLVFYEEIREICKGNVCRNYGATWACPPAIGTI